MPYSFSTFDEKIYELITGFKPMTALDVGPGAGKIGSMLSKASRRNGHPCIIDAYEIYEPYIKKYELRWIYDNIYNESIMNIMNKDKVFYDMIFFGDSLEHLTKEDGLKLIDFLLPRCLYIIIKTPSNMQQGPVDGNIHEAHLSNWTEADFDMFLLHTTEEHPSKTSPGTFDLMNLFILKGKA